MSKNLPFQTNRAPAAIGPYSQAVINGNMMFVSGQIPLDPDNMKIVEGGIEAQARRSFENMLNVVMDSEFEISSIAKVTIFIRNMDDFGLINEIYSDVMNGHRPARAVVEVSRLPKDALIETECICVR